MSHPQRQPYPPLKMAEPAPVVEARPSEDQARMDALCARLAQGDLLKDAAPALFGSIRSFYRSLDRHPEFRRSYDNARLLQSHYYAEEGLEIVDTEPDANRARVRSGYRQWLASRYNPADYGEHVSLDVRGEINVLEVMSEATRRSMRDLPPIDAEIVPSDESGPELPGSLE